MTTAATERRVRIPKDVMRRARLYGHNELYKAALPLDYDKWFVPGAGNVLSPLVLVGEAPSEEEADRQVPFVGRSGALLDELLAYAGIEREDIYITNLVKSRPPVDVDLGRRPDDTTLLAAVQLMRRELHIIKPRIVVPLGPFATMLLWRDAHMGLVAGQRYTVKLYENSERTTIAMPMHHPSWVLRNGKEARAQAFTHMRQVRDTLDRLMKVLP